MTEPVDLSWAVQRAVYAALTAAGVPITDNVIIDGNMPPEQIYFGEDAVQELGSKTESLERHDLTINVMVTGSSREPMRAWQARIKAALHDQPITADGAVLSNPQFQTANGGPTEISTILGTQTFLVWAQAPR